MRNNTFITTGLLAITLGSGAALAQRPTPPPDLIRGQHDPTANRGDDIYASGGVRMRAVRARPSDIQVGRSVRDRSDRYIGRIASVDSSSAVVRFRGDRTVVVPLREFWDADGTLTLQLSRSDFGRLAGLR